MGWVTANATPAAGGGEGTEELTTHRSVGETARIGGDGGDRERPPAFEVYIEDEEINSPEENNRKTGFPKKFGSNSRSKPNSLQRGFECWRSKSTGGSNAIASGFDAPVYDILSNSNVANLRRSRQ